MLARLHAARLELERGGVGFIYGLMAPGLRLTVTWSRALHTVRTKVGGSRVVGLCRCGSVFCCVFIVLLCCVFVVLLFAVLCSVVLPAKFSCWFARVYCVFNFWSGVDRVGGYGGGSVGVSDGDGRGVCWCWCWWWCWHWCW